MQKQIRVAGQFLPLISKIPTKQLALESAWVKAAKKRIQAVPREPEMKDGKPVEVFTYCFYVPERPNVVVVDADKPLDKQP